MGANYDSKKLILAWNCGRAFLGLSLFLSLEGWVVAQGVPSGAVVISAGSDIQTAVNNNPAGTTFYLKAGAYRLQSITAKNGNTFIGETGAVLNGAKLLTSFTSSGSYWIAAGQTQAVPIDTTSHASCMGDSPRCLYAEELFFDDVRLKHVSNLRKLRPGEWFYDAAKGVVYIGQDPTGHKVERSITRNAFTSASGSNVTVKNVIIEKYANASSSGALAPSEQQALGWTIGSNEIRLNHGAGMRVGSGSKVLRNKVHHNGQIGIMGLGSNILVEGNEISFNNDAGFYYGWEAGGTKFLYTTNLVIRNNYAHDNRGPGLWTDYNNYYVTYESNRSAHNGDFGIAHELGGDATIRYNVVENMGPSEFHTTRLWNNGAIALIMSRRANVYGNTLINNTAGIVALQDTRRGTLPTGETVDISELNVHDNVTVQNTNIAAGGLAATDGSIFASRNNRFTNNTYKLSNLTAGFYIWATGLLTKDQWKTAGEDVSGTWISPTDSSFPSTKFAAGDRVRTTVSTEVRSLPSTKDGTLLGTQPAGALGTVTLVRGPILTLGSWWWQVSYDSGLKGWSTEVHLTTTDLVAIQGHGTGTRKN